jgi:hypothetical protein
MSVCIYVFICARQIRVCQVSFTKKIQVLDTHLPYPYIMATEILGYLSERFDERDVETTV